MKVGTNENTKKKVDREETEKSHIVEEALQTQTRQEAVSITRGKKKGQQHNSPIYL